MINMTRPSFTIAVVLLVASTFVVLSAQVADAEQQVNLGGICINPAPVEGRGCQTHRFGFAPDRTCHGLPLIQDAIDLCDAVAASVDSIRLI